jgi:hypothetical protein
LGGGGFFSPPQRQDCETYLERAARGVGSGLGR